MPLIIDYFQLKQAGVPDSVLFPMSELKKLKTATNFLANTFIFQVMLIHDTKNIVFQVNWVNDNYPLPVLAGRSVYYNSVPVATGYPEILFFASDFSRQRPVLVMEDPVNINAYQMWCTIPMELLLPALDFVNF